MPNQLIHSLSPYLLQHAHNPVDWHPWGEAALAKAKAEQKPIFLSIGYSACHWCHVMERESFEDPTVAAVLNAHFVSIKVDREERPDLDDLYMDAVQAITGRGGWPMSVWLTPDLEPFHGGTYFPPEPRQGMPGFRSLLERIAEVWATDGDQLRQQAGSLTQQLRRAAALAPGEVGPGDEVLEAALLQLRQSYDPRWGGFGPAPKFPQAMAVELILARGSATDRAMARRTLDAMGDGGMYDHLGGGFARYSVDGQWLVPHFEKMLYDNAQLATCYLAAFQAFGEPRYAQMARETLDYLIRDLRDPAGGFHGAEDADSEGEEGRFYVFTPTQVAEALGPADAARFCAAYGVTEAGNFEHGQSVLHRFSAASDAVLPEAEDAALRLKLRQWRDHRVRPAKDDKVLAAWNGLALAALARGAQVLGDARYLEAAQACAAFLRRELWTGQGLLRVWRGGQAHTPAFLEDEAAVADGLVDLFETDFDPAWLHWAEELGEGLLARFHDPVGGGFYSTLAGQGDLIFRQKPGFDQALPSGNTLAARALLRLSRHLQRPDFREAAEGVMKAFGPWMARAPRAFLGLLAVLDSSRRAPLELSLSGRPGDPEVEALLRAIHARHLPGRTLTVSEREDLPLHKGRQRVPGRAEAFACRGSVCAAPAQGVEALEALLDGPFARSRD